MDCTAKESQIQPHKHSFILFHPLEHFYIGAGSSKRESDNHACSFVRYYAYLRILIDCFADNNYLLEYRIAKHASERRNKKKGQKKERRYAKALMIFRALTVCHLHDDNGQL